MPKWLKEEEELFEAAWNAYEQYDREDLEELFGRNWGALRKKADSMRLESRDVLEQKARIEAIRKTLEGAHII